MIRSLTVTLAAVAWLPFAHAAPLRFSDQTDAAGLDFVHAQTPDHRSGPMGGGGAVGDFDGDGYADVFILGGGARPDALFMNNRDGTFTDRAAQWGLSGLHRGVGATVGDFDADGDDDLYVTSFGPAKSNATPGRHRLWRNDGGRFENVATIAGVATTTTTHPDGYGAAFGDYDRDGDLDLFVGAWHNAQIPGARLFRNAGDGTFADVTATAGLLVGNTLSFGAIWADMDGDHYPELLVAGDFGSSRYFRNNRDGTFAHVDPGSGLPMPTDSDQWSTGKAYNAMGATVGDFNRDGQADWFVTAIWPSAAFASDFWGNGLYINHGSHIYTQLAAGAGVHDGGWGWGVAASDFDHDGWTDLMMTNGWPLTDTVTGANFANERAYLWRNRGDMTFAQSTKEAGLAHTGEGRALLTLDYDRDGDMDVVILAHEEPAQLWRNDVIGHHAPRDAHWLQVQLDTRRNGQLAPRGVGARVTVMAGGVTRTEQITTGGTYLGQRELVAHFGLGRARVIRELSVVWGDGRQTLLRHVHANQRITIQAPRSSDAHDRPDPSPAPAPDTIKTLTRR